MSMINFSKWLDCKLKSPKRKRGKEKPPATKPSAFIPSPHAAPTTESPNRSRVYRDTCYWRTKTLNAVRHLKDEDILSGVQFISQTECVKLGTAVQLSEAAALLYVAKHSSVPVPKVHCAFQRNGKTYILMERINGEEIGKGWAKRSEAEKENLMAQLKGIFEELRNIPHPRPGTLAAADMQALYDPRTWKGGIGFGPFANESDFNNFLRCGIQADSEIIDKHKVDWVTQEEKDEIRRLISLHESKQHQICFTHGDASSSNILVKNGKIVGLIDFELSGFYPEYWEYTTAMNVNPYDGFWKAEIPRFLKEYPEELEMEKLRKKHFSSLGFRDVYPWS